MHFVPQPLSSYLHGPTDDTILCSSIPDSTLVVNEDQTIDEVGVAQPTCVVIPEEYDWDLEYQPSTKDESLPSKPPPFFPSILGDLVIHDFECVSPSMNAPIVDHSKNTLDVIPSSDNGDDKLFTKNPLEFSSTFS